MPNDFRSRRDKKEKEKKRKTKKDPKPVYKKPPSEDLDFISFDAEEALALSFSRTAESVAARNKTPNK
jgi:hypothetical protein